MPWSSPEGKHALKRALMRRFPRGARVLDVGPGAGAIRDLLPREFVMDAVEIFAPYVERFNLTNRYARVFVDDIRTFHTSERYDAIILGDVLEHLSADDAAALIARLPTLCAHALFSVPWCWVQGPSEGNDAETHLQPDLTPAIMAGRFPSLVPVFTGGVIGVYEWSGEPCRDSVTICIPTYGRTKLLPIALHGALRVIHTGRVNVLVMNDCPDQRLSVNSPRVRVINRPSPFPTLGDKRNAMVAECASEWIAWLDDDDYILPHHLDRLRMAAINRTPVDGFSSSTTYYFCGEKGEVTTGACADAIVRTSAYQRAPFPALDVGEDWASLRVLADSGTLLPTPPTTPSYVQRWCNGAYHVSGLGQTSDAIARFRANVQQRIDSGDEPIGDIHIASAPGHDYPTLCAGVLDDFLNKFPERAP